ncbi:MAG: hypothetical protein EWM45_06625 [Rhodopseudomonas palustris]|nr:MAG: hypothetical protein EWM45_06625 [Rhodopseudomonas palustris]
MAQIVPFPPARRVDFVERHARMIAGMSAEAGEGHMQRQIDIQRQTLERKGVAADLIEAELKALESAIRAALWRTIMAPGGRA